VEEIIIVDFQLMIAKFNLRGHFIFSFLFNSFLKVKIKTKPIFKDLAKTISAKSKIKWGRPIYGQAILRQRRGLMCF
jgi:hypothetical protein